ncbi:MAG: rhomboid family intramembrane serine protease [Deltaproteobacteria bacterium]|nr:rhomboid family intramembrane serine protease [Deltaproteobacteria bacterium]
MIPIKDDIPSRTFPVVNITLIILNIFFFLVEVSLGDRLNLLFGNFGVVPAKFFASYYITGDRIVYIGAADRIIPLFTSMFLHGGWFHLLGNMLYLWIFGDNVEDRMGHLRYLIFYILCGIVASLTHIIFNPSSNIPSVGASGAIAGVLGAYMLSYPTARVVVLVVLFFYIDFIALPALLVLGFWFVMQFFSGVLSLGVESASSGGVAWWAHIGGFVAGMALLFVFRKRNYRITDRDLWWIRR